MPTQKDNRFVGRTNKSRAPFWGMLLISAATLLLEIAWTRILSVTLWYHFAFMTLSTALFGFGAAGVLISFRATAISDRMISTIALLTPVAFFVGFALSNTIPFEPFSLGKNPVQWLYLLAFFLTATLPFFFSGLTISALLYRHAKVIHRLYLFDLLGAGIGAVSVVFLLPITGGSGTIFFASGMAALGGLLIARPPLKWAYPYLAAAISALCIAPWGDSLIAVRISHNKITGDGVPLETVFSNPKFHQYTGWNAASRVDVVAWQDNRGRKQQTIFIDGGTAVTRIAHPMGPIAGLKPGRDEESFFLRRVPNANVLVVGSGGGREVLLAVQAGAKKVTGVEINPDINYVVKHRFADFTGRLYHHPKVTVHTDEARHFIERSTEKYDVIHCPHTISNAAMASGSLSLAENYLLTQEAFDAYLNHLSDDGVLLITRPEAHLLRLFSTARVALSALNEPSPLSKRVIAWRRPAAGQSFYGGFALKNSPFTEDDIKRFAQTLKQNRLEPLYLPGYSQQPPYTDLVSNTPFEKIPLAFPAILTPATDDKPFFNRRVPFNDITLADLSAVFTQSTKGRIALENRPVTEAALISLLLESLAVALIFIIGPLVIFRRDALSGKGRLSTITAFFALGLAYITIEIGLIHRLTLYLGRPTVVMATVLGTLLISSGLGSAFSARLKGSQSAMRAALTAAATCVVTTLLLPPIIQTSLTLSDPVRIIVAIVVLIPSGFAMGMPFPLLLSRLSDTHPERIPWAFGINGLASVIGTVIALLIAMTLGQTAVLACGVLCYGMAALAGQD